MPKWVDKWKGGRFYLDDEGRQVFVIEAMRDGVRYTAKLDTHDPELALGELVRFNADPAAFVRPPPPPKRTTPEAVYITKERVKLYLESIRDTVEDHRRARLSYLHAWAELGLDLRTVDRKALRAALARFEGGHRGRTEALNAFARFLVKEEELPAWNPLVNTRAPEASRAPREAYDLKTLHATFKRLEPGPVRDVFHIRAATGLHHTEIEQIAGIRVVTAPLPEKGVALRQLDGKHEIAGVLQVAHKNGQFHRQPVDAFTLAAALRLRDGVPDRITTWEALDPVIPSNLRHSFVTLAGECGQLVSYEALGVDRARIARAIGHRRGSSTLADHYDFLQVPPMVKIPLPWVPSSAPAVTRKKRLLHQSSR